MNERDRLAMRILRDALDAEPDRRDAFVAERCGDDLTLRARVESLLREADSLDAAPPDPAAPPADASVDDRADALIGTRLGPFVVSARIGRGGMGVVYRGERENADFAQTVAIKLIRRGFDFDDVAARFLRERRILARLSHPNLARFIDGGVAPDGRPWFALEFVRGESITAWCDRRRLDVRARVRLFLDVCAAVQHAHAQLVVHRDLKPANVLVDDAGQVRLLDFGIARLLAGDDGEPGAPTTIGLRYALTPEYAAPEQFGGETAGVATDIYALGVLLYQLVAGVLPYALDRTDLVASERTVRETPPQALAAAIARPADAARGEPDPAARLAARDTTLRAYRADVRGDLGRIVETALAKEPERRYATVEAFAEDLRRWRAGDPVRVSGNRLGYRLGKFVRRNRAAVAITVALAAGLAFASAYAIHRAEREYRQRVRAETTLSFMRDIFDANTPENTDGEKLTAMQLLDRAGERIGEYFPDDPPAQAELSGQLGDVYSSLTLHERAVPFHERAVALLRERSDRSDPVYLMRVLALANAYYETYRFDDALALVDRDLEAARGVEIGGEPFYGRLLAMRSAALNRLGRMQEAEAGLREAIALYQRSGVVASGGYGEMYIDLGYTLLDGGDLDGALEAFRSAETILHSAPGSTKLQQLSNRLNIGTVYIRTGDSAQAVAVLEPLIGQYEALLGASSGHTMTARSKLAQAYAADGRYVEALDAIDANLRAVADSGVEDPRDRIEIGLVKAKLATYALQLEVARPLVLQTRAYIAESMREPSFARGRLQWVIGEFWLQAGDCDAAEPMLEAARADALATSTDGAANPSVAEAEDSLGRCRLQRGDYAGAREHLDRAVATFGEVLGADHRRSVRSRIHRAWVDALADGDAAAFGRMAALRPLLVTALGTDDKPVVWQLDLMLDDLARRAGAAPIDPARRRHAEDGLKRISRHDRVPRYVGLNSFS